jgi:predicted dehydrogenase
MIRYGIAGFGLHAVQRLMPGFAGAKNSCCVALSRRDHRQAAENAAHYGIPHVFTSTEELCACPEVDAVFIATPNSVHLDDVRTAARHGKAILCEKPLSTHLAEAEQMVEIARSAGVLFGVAQCFRFTRSVERVRARLAEGAIGEPIFARCDFSFLGSNSRRIWLNDPTLSGGGPIADIGVHCIDTLRYVLGAEPSHVSALTRFDEGAGGVETAATLQLRFRDKTLASVDVSFSSPYRTLLEVVGSKGILHAEHGLCVDSPVTIELLREGKCLDRETVDNADAYSRQADAFSAALEGKGEFLIPGEDGVANQRVLDAAYRSARSGLLESTGL